MFDSSLLILSKKQNRLDRALKRKNLPLEQIQNRMSLQMSEKEKIHLLALAQPVLVHKNRKVR